MPLAGRSVADKYMLWLVRVKSSRSISMRLLSNSLLVPTDVLHPTPLCQIAYETLLLLDGDPGSVKSAKNSMSIRVSISSSASGFTSSNSSPASCSLACSSGDSSNKTFRARDAFLVEVSTDLLLPRGETYRVRFLLTPQKKLSSHGCSCSAS